MARTRLVAVFIMVLGAGSALAPAAQAAPECRGVSAVIQCWDQRVQECLRDLRYPLAPC